MEYIDKVEEKKKKDSQSPAKQKDKKLPSAKELMSSFHKDNPELAKKYDLNEKEKEPETENIPTTEAKDKTTPDSEVALPEASDEKAADLPIAESAEEKAAKLPVREDLKVEPDDKKKTGAIENPEGAVSNELPADVTEIVVAENALPEVKESGDVRLTDMSQPALDGGVERMETESKDLLEQVDQNLTTVSETNLTEKNQKIAGLGTNQKKKEDATTKLKKTKDAVEEKPEEKQSEANAKQVTSISQIPTPEVKKDDAKKTLTDSLQDSLPDTVKGVDEFKDSGVADKIGEEVKKTVSAKTSEISGTFSQLEKTEKPDNVKQSVPLGDIEKATPTSGLKLSDELVPPVQEDALDLSSYIEESDNLLKKEGITEEHLAMVDSGDLAEAKDLRGEIDSKSTEHPANLKKEEKDIHAKNAAELNYHESLSREKMQKDRESGLRGSQSKQSDTKSSFEKKKEEVTQHVNGIYEDTNKKVQEKLEHLQTAAFENFARQEKIAGAAFGTNVHNRVEAWKKKRYCDEQGETTLAGAALMVKDWMLGISDMPDVKLILDTERDAYISKIDAAITQIISDSQKVIDECKGLIAKARKDIDVYVKGLSPALQKIGQDAQKDIQKKLDELDAKVNKAAEDLKNELNKKRAEAIANLDSKIEAMRKEMSGALSQIGDLLSDAALKLFEWAVTLAGYSMDDIMPFINKGKAVLTAIVDDPETFFNNLGAGVGGGIKNFVTNAGEHLKSGLFDWLTGAMSGIPIQFPDKWDLKGIFSFISQVLGFGWETIKTKFGLAAGLDADKISKVETAIVKGEEGMDEVKKVKEEGVAGAMELVEDQVATAKETAIAEVSEWAITAIIKAAVPRVLLMLNPAGAIAQIIAAIVKTVIWFRTNFERISRWANTVFNSVVEIAGGAIGSATAKVEQSMAQAIPVILGFLAEQLGLGNVSDGIQKALNKIRKPIDKIVDRIVAWIADKAKRIINKIKKFLGKDKKKEEEEKDGIPDKNKSTNDNYVSEIRSRIEKVDTDKTDSIKELYNQKVQEASRLEKVYERKLKQQNVSAIIEILPIENEKSFDVKISIGSSKVKFSMALNSAKEHKFADISVAFDMDGAAHHILVKIENGNPEISMASTEEHLQRKWAGFKKSIAKYREAISEENILAELNEMEGQCESSINKLFALKSDLNAFAEQSMNTKLTSENENQVNEARIKRIKEKIDSATGLLKAFGVKYGIKGLDPLDLEMMEIESRVAPLRERLSKIVDEFRADLEKAVPPGSRVLYRGSLANGIRSFKGARLSDAAELIKPNYFDCDAFIDVSDEQWKQIYDNNFIARKDGKINVDSIEEWKYSTEIYDVGVKIQNRLNQERWYKKKDGEADFYFYIQSRNKTSNQEKHGNVYPEEALSKAGFPYLEDSLPHIKDDIKTYKKVSATKLPVKSKKL
jgi:hypothetical protein